MFKVKFLLIPLFLLMINTAVAAENGQRCPRPPAPSVDVIAISSKVRYDYSQSEDFLGTMQIDTKNPYGDNVETSVGGLSRGEISVQTKLSVGGAQNPQTNESCLWYDRVRVNLEIDPTVYIASSHKRGSCMFKAIMNHELKHVKVDRAVLKKYTPYVRQAVEQAIKTVGVVRVPEHRVQEIRDKMQLKVQLAIKPVLARMNQEQQQRQQAVDSLQEYERVANECPDERQKYWTDRRKNGSNSAFRAR